MIFVILKCCCVQNQWVCKFRPHGVTGVWYLDMMSWLLCDNLPAKGLSFQLFPHMLRVCLRSACRVFERTFLERDFSVCWMPTNPFSIVFGVLFNRHLNVSFGPLQDVEWDRSIHHLVIKSNLITNSPRIHVCRTRLDDKWK